MFLQMLSSLLNCHISSRPIVIFKLSVFVFPVKIGVDRRNPCYNKQCKLLSQMTNEQHARIITVHIECVNVDGISANVINLAFVYMP